MNSASTIREKFLRDDEIDSGAQAALVRKLKEQRHKKIRLAPLDSALMEVVQKKIDTISTHIEEEDEVESEDHLVKMGLTWSGSDRTGVMKGRTVVDAGIEQYAVWELAKMSREAMAAHYKDGGLERCARALPAHYLPRQPISLGCTRAGP